MRDEHAQSSADSWNMGGNARVYKVAYHIPKIGRSPSVSARLCTIT
jgi:hypothetical protein